MKKLHAKVMVLTIFMISSLSVNGVDDNNHFQPQKISWFSWFKSYIPGTNEYKSRQNNIISKRIVYKDGTLSVGREFVSYKNGAFSFGTAYSQSEVRFYVACYSLLDGGYLFNPENGQRKNVNFESEVSKWKNNLVRSLETWEENSKQEYVSEEFIRLNMWNNVNEVIDTLINGEIINLTPTEKNFLIVVRKDLHQRIMRK